jgi:hypothetical protein
MSFKIRAVKEGQSEDLEALTFLVCLVNSQWKGSHISDFPFVEEVEIINFSSCSDEDRAIFEVFKLHLIEKLLFHFWGRFIPKF